MRHQFRLACQAGEKVAEHLKGALGRFATCPKIDQHASDDRAVALNLNAVLVVADQMGTAECVNDSETTFAVC